MLKRRLIPLVVIASLAGGTAVAQAVVPKGTYTGKFSDGGTASLTVNKERLLIKVTRKGLTFKCTDGDSFKSLKSTATGDVDVSSGSFDINDTNTSDAVTWSMQGKFSTKKRKVKGTYKETRTFNASNQLDPNGSVTCETAALTYSAALPKKK
jgi:hypothetical protein